VWLDEIERDSKISPGIKRSFGVKTFSLNPNTSTFYFRNFKNNYVIDHSMTELSFQLKLPRCFMADQVRYIDFPQGATSVFEELKSVRNPFENLVGVVKIYFDPLSWSFLMSFLTQNSNISSLEIAFFEFNVIYFMNASDLQNIPHIKTLFVPLSNFIRHKDLFLVKFPNIQSLGIIDDIGTDWEQKRFRSQIEYFQAVNNLFEWIDKHQVKNLLIETSISEILLPRINSVLKNITTIVFQSPARYPLCQRDGLEPDAIDLSQLARLFPKAHHLWVRSSRVVGRYNNKNLLPTDWKQISLVQCSPLHKKAPLVELPRTIFPNLDEVKTYACGTFAIEARLNLANEKYDPLFFARALMDPNIITPLSPK
jgi:hypothetical protein